MVIDKEFIDSQKRSESGFIMELKAENDAQKMLLKELQGFKAQIKNSKLKLNRDFYDQASAIYNFAILNGENLNDFLVKLNQLEDEAKKGIYTSTAKPGEQKNYGAKNTSNKYTQQKPSNDTAQQQESKPKQKFEPIMNENGFVMVFKPKNKNQELIAEQFDKFYAEHIQGKGFSKEFINKFNSSRNYYTQQEIEKEKIDKFLEATRNKIEKGDAFKKEDTNKIIEELSEKVKKLETQVAELQMAISNTTEDKKSKASVNNPLVAKYIDARIKEVREVMKGKGYTKEDFSELYGLKEQKFVKEEHFEEVLKEFRARADERLEQRKAEAQNNDIGQTQTQENSQISNTQSEVLKKYSTPSEEDINPNDDTAMNELKDEAKAFNVKNTQTQRTMQTQRYSQHISSSKT